MSDPDNIADIREGAFAQGLARTFRDIERYKLGIGETAQKHVTVTDLDGRRRTMTITLPKTGRPE